MINPDGVILGNFRTSYSGKDLNRQFLSLDKRVFPEVEALNQFVKNLKEHYKGKFAYYFDLHGHSTKSNLFCYGPEHSKTSPYYLRSRAFAKLIE
jgi:murein tripeptide amidase MpaA